MSKNITILLIGFGMVLLLGCSQKNKTSGVLKPLSIKAADMLGNPAYPAFSYGGYRQKSRTAEPGLDQLKEDLVILAAMGIKLLRTYNTAQFSQTANILKAIRELKEKDPNFEMYLMIGTWIECDGAWTRKANHFAGNLKNNTAEINAAVNLANKYPDIVKMIAVGNESMVQWAINYFVYPAVILKWVNYLQGLKKTGKLSADLWITSSDNYESWGGGAANYQSKDLVALINAVDFVSMHTYPFHDTFYNPAFWGVPANEEGLSEKEKATAALLRARDYAIGQYKAVAAYIKSQGLNKSIHIGETGWASIAGTSYGTSGSMAADEFKQKMFYDLMRAWTSKAGISCFYFEAFDESWKDSNSSAGSENHFGLITIEGKAKYALWKMVDDAVFKGLTRNGTVITKTYNGNEKALMADLLATPLIKDLGIVEITNVNKTRKAGQLVTEHKYIVVYPTMVPNEKNGITYPSAKIKLNAWEGTCGIKMSIDSIIDITTGTGSWWGCALEHQSGGAGENLTEFITGYLNMDIKANTTSSFKIGFQTGLFSKGNQVNNFITVGPGKMYTAKNNWTSFKIPFSKLNKGADLKNVTSILYLTGDSDFDGKHIYLKNIFYSTK